MRLLAIIKVSPDDMTEMVNGKPRAAWTFIQASSSRYVHETWILWPGHLSGPDYLGDRPEDIKGVIEAANSQKKDNVDIVALLDAGNPLRGVDWIDRCFDAWLDNQAKRIEGDGIAVDAAKKYLMDVVSEPMPIELGEPPALDALALYEYVKDCLTETGYVQHSGKYNTQVATGKLPWEYRFSFFNHFTIFNEFSNGKAADVSSARNEIQQPCLIIGSGSSLDDALPLMKDWKGAVFCSTGHASSLLHAGFKGPMFMICFDIWTRKVELEWMGDFGDADITLVSHPGVNPELIAAWKGKKLYFRCVDLNNFFFSDVLPKAYDMINTSMLLFASSAAAQMSIANCLGFGPLFMAGVDFSLIRFQKWIWEILTPEISVVRDETDEDKMKRALQMINEGHWITPPSDIVQPSTGQWVCRPDIDPVAAKPIKADNGVWTDPLQVFYKLSALTVWRIDHCQCISTSRKSAVSEMPYAPIEEVIARQGRGFEEMFISSQEIDDRVELYLARKNNFIVRFKEGGVRAVEAGSPGPDGWRRDLETYIARANMATMRTEGKEQVDFKANMDRFEWLKGRT